MKKLALALLLLAPLTPAWAGDDLLENSDFSDGINHWYGNCKTPAEVLSEDADAPISPTATGLVVKLRHNDWTKVTQDFEAKPGSLALSMTYSVSAGLTFSTRPDDYTNVPGSIGFSAWAAFASQPGQWVMMLCDIASGHATFWKITPKPGTAPQTYNTAFDGMKSDERKTICLAFPPGDGLIIFQKISLTSGATITQ
jgi:hypothetical protein